MCLLSKSVSCFMVFSTTTDDLENSSENIFLYDLYIFLVQTNIVKLWNYEQIEGWLNTYDVKQASDIC